MGLVTQSVPVPSHARKPLSFCDIRFVWQPWATSNPLSPTTSPGPASLAVVQMGGPEAKVARAPELVVWQEDQGLSGQWVTGQWQGGQVDDTCGPQMCPPHRGGYLGQGQR